MARGGASGGGRSSGGGGGRSSGGRSVGGGFSRGGVSGGSSRGGSGGFGGTGRSPRGYQSPPPRRSSGLGPMMMGYGLGRMSGPRGGGYGGAGRRPASNRGGCGCLGVSIAVILVMVLIAVFFLAAPAQNNSGGAAGGVTASTIAREALPKGSVNETEYYTDELGWIGNSTTLIAGMKNFYQKTGVQPYLYLTDTVEGSHSPTNDQLDQFAHAKYDALFTDEAHLLLVFFEYDSSGQPKVWYVAGSQAKTVLDDEAMNILLDYIDRYYYDSSLTDEQMFSKSFDNAGERIMSVTTSPWIPVLIVAGVLVILVVLFLWWRSHKKQKNLEAEQTRKILDTPLETFGDTDAAERAKKYEDK